MPTKHVFQFADVAGLDAAVSAALGFADLGGNPGRFGTVERGHDDPGMTAPFQPAPSAL